MQLKNCLSKRFLLQRAKNPKSVSSVLKERYLVSKSESSLVDFANSPNSKSLSGWLKQHNYSVNELFCECVVSSKMVAIFAIIWNDVIGFITAIVSIWSFREIAGIMNVNWNFFKSCNTEAELPSTSHLLFYFIPRFFFIIHAFHLAWSLIITYYVSCKTFFLCLQNAQITLQKCLPYRAN